MSPEVLDLQQLTQCPVLYLYQYLEGTLQLEEPLILRGFVLAKGEYHLTIIRSQNKWHLNKLEYATVHDQWSDLLSECFELEVAPVLAVYERSNEAKINLSINDPLRKTLEHI